MPILRPVLAAVALAALAATVSARAEDAPPPRVPTEGIPILDCAPPPPAPQASCTLRLPPGHRRDGLRSRPIEADDAAGGFEFVRIGDEGFPDGLAQSATLLLVDLTPGPGFGREPYFAQEKALVRELAEALPADELVGVWGFHRSLDRLADFTTERAVVLETIDGLAITGRNTRITTSARAAIGILTDRRDVLFRHLVIVTDGEEEGIAAIDEVTEAARDAGVAVTALGLLWRPIGARENGLGMDFIDRLAAGTHGAHLAVELRRQDAGQAVAGFAAGLAAARRQSGLVLPRGEPRPAIISVTLRAPSDAGAMLEREVSANFVLPEAAPPQREAAPEPEPEPELAAWYGSATVAGLIGGTVLAGAAGVFALMRTRRRQTGAAEEADDEVQVEAQDAARDDAQVPVATHAARPSSRPVAYLVREDTGERHPITSARTALGRSLANAVVIPHDSISRVHAELHRNRDGGFSVTDMDSLNGTYVNDAPVSGTRTVAGGDTIRVGNVRMKLVLAWPEAGGAGEVPRPH